MHVIASNRDIFYISLLCILTGTASCKWQGMAPVPDTFRSPADISNTRMARSSFLNRFLRILGMQLKENKHENKYKMCQYFYSLFKLLYNFCELALGYIVPKFGQRIVSTRKFIVIIKTNECFHFNKINK